MLGDEGAQTCPLKLVRACATHGAVVDACDGDAPAVVAAVDVVVHCNLMVGVVVTESAIQALLTCRVETHWKTNYW